MKPPKHRHARTAAEVTCHSLVDELMASATAPLPVEDRQKRLARMAAGLEELTHADKPGIPAWEALRDAVYLMETLIGGGEAPVLDEHGKIVASYWRGCDGEPIEIADSQRLLQDAMLALAAAGQRVLDGQTMRLSGVGLHAVRSLLEDYEAVIEALPARTMIRCFRRTRGRVREQMNAIGPIPKSVRIVGL